MTSPPHVPPRLTEELRAFTDATPADAPDQALLAELDGHDRTTGRQASPAVTAGVRRWGGVIAMAMSVLLIVLAIGAGLPRLARRRPCRPH